MTIAVSLPFTGAKKAHLVVAVILVAIGFALLAPTRLDISILLPEVMHAVAVTSLGAGGFIATATLIGDGVCEMFWGHVSDSWSRTGTLALGIALYSTFSILTAAALNLPLLYLTRILLGVGQAMYIPAYFAFLGGIYGKRRGLILGSLGGMFSVGTALNPILTKDMFQATHHWQTPFIAYGAFGLVLALCIYLCGRHANRIFDTQFHELQAPPAVSKAGQRYWLLDRNMMFLCITMMFWGLTQYGFLAIFVTYLRENQHFTLGEAARVAAIAGWFSFAFSFVAGYVSDHIGRRWSLLIFGVVAMLLAAPIFVLPQTFVSAAVFASIFQAANGIFYPMGIAYAQDFAGARHLGVHTGAVSGIGHLIAGIAGFISGSIAATFGFAALGWFFVAASVVMVATIALTQDPRHMMEPQFATSTS